jgi:gamma-glutamyltranspeptidase/glutathione hydrolase
VIEKVKYIGKTEMIVLDDNGNIHAVADGRGDDSVATE